MHHPLDVRSCRSSSSAPRQRGALASLLTVAVTLALLPATPSWATSGLMPLGYGAIQNGMSGAGTALASNAAATMRNPGASAWLGDELVLGVDIAAPDGHSSTGPVGAGSTLGLYQLSPGSQSLASGVLGAPGFAWNARLDDRSAWGISLSAAGLTDDSSGGSATLLRGVPLVQTQCKGLLGGGGPVSASSDPLSLCGGGKSDLSLEIVQLFLAAHYSRLLTPDLSIGVSPLLVGQSLSVEGMSVFNPFSNDPGRTSDNGRELSWGAGARVGLLWKPLDIIHVGASYQSKVSMRDSKDYEGLLPGGSFDIPPAYSIGLLLSPAAEHRVVLDVERIDYHANQALSNPVNAQRLTDRCLIPRIRSMLLLPGGSTLPSAACFGGSDGPGLGWRDLAVYKIGYQFQHGRLALRAGYAQSKRPMSSDQALAATVAPAASDQHLSRGLSWTFSPRLQLDAALQRALPSEVKGVNPLSNGTVVLLPFGIITQADARDQQVNATLDVWQVGLGMTWRFAGTPQP